MFSVYPELKYDHYSREVSDLEIVKQYEILTVETQSSRAKGSHSVWEYIWVKNKVLGVKF